MTALYGLLFGSLLSVAYLMGRIMGADAMIENAKKIGVQFALEETQRLLEKKEQEEQP